jgi:hypothetical protein
MNTKPKIEELIDVIKFRASGIGQAPDYDYKTFFYEVRDILNDPKWKEQSEETPTNN